MSIVVGDRATASAMGFLFGRISARLRRGCAGRARGTVASRYYASVTGDGGVLLAGQPALLGLHDGVEVVGIARGDGDADDPEGRAMDIRAELAELQGRAPGG